RRHLAGPPNGVGPGLLAAYLASLELTVLTDLAAVLLSLLFGFAATLLTFCWIAALGGRANRSLATLHSAAAQYKILSPGAPLAVVGSSQSCVFMLSGHALADVRTALRRLSQAMARFHAALDTVTANLHAARRVAAAVSSSAADAAAARSVPLSAEAAARISDALEVGVLE
ncbi:hypothetical protein HK405_008974, partial [Cladochytrium tenue]